MFAAQVRRVLLIAGLSGCYATVQAQGTPAPTADELFRRYVVAAGGEAAIRALKTRVTSGELIAGGGMRAPLEIYQAEPDRFLRVLRNAQVKLSENGFDGATAWSSNDGTQRELAGPEVTMLRREYHLHRPVELSRFYPDPASVTLDTLDGHRVYRVTYPGEALYFDRDTGLLDGWDTVVQGTTIATRLQDYRTVDGVRIPFRVVRSRPGFTWTEQATDIRHNVAIDPAKFAKRN
jgi:hypothetical protein